MSINTHKHTCTGPSILERRDSLPPTDPGVKDLNAVLKPLSIMPPNSIQDPVENGQPHPIPRGASGAGGLPLACLGVVALNHTHSSVPIPPTDGIELLVGLAGVESVRLNLHGEEMHR